MKMWIVISVWATRVFIGLVPCKEQHTVVLCSECAWTDHIMNRNFLCQVPDTDLSSVVVI